MKTNPFPLLNDTMSGVSIAKTEIKRSQQSVYPLARMSRKLPNMEESPRKISV